MNTQNKYPETYTIEELQDAIKYQQQKIKDFKTKEHEIKEEIKDEIDMRGSNWLIHKALELSTIESVREQAEAYKMTMEKILYR